MFIAATRRTAFLAASRSGGRTLYCSARVLNVPTTSSQKPITSQPVKVAHGAAPKSPPSGVSQDIKEKVVKNNEQQAPKKKLFTLFGFLWKTAFVVSAVYGGTLFAATKNDKVMDFVIDKQLPYYEQLLDLIEYGSSKDIEASWKNIKAKFSFPSKDQLEEFTTKIEQQSGHLIEETKKKLSNAKSSLPSEQLQEAVGVEAVRDQIEKIPLVALKDGVAGLADKSVKDTINSFNELIDLLDGSNIGLQKDAMVKKISENISALSAKLAALNNSFEKELQAGIKKTEDELLTAFTRKELELTQNMLDQYNYEKAQLETKYKERLTKELDAAQKALGQAAVNATTMVRVEQTKRFEKMVKDKIDQERDGRLKNLDALDNRLRELEAFATSLELLISATASRSLILRASAKLKSLLHNTPEDAPAQNLAPYVSKLESACAKSDDELLNLALAELKPLLKNESSQSILTIPQLLSAWEQLTPELRSASLLPPNAGLLGHLASALLSKLLLPVKGSKPEGKDIESVIGRVEQNLIRGELDAAVEEVASLKGWSRKLADDWVREGRKRLEAEFLIDLIDAETKVL